MPETLYLAVHLVDRYLEREQTTRSRLQLVGATALFLAAKYTCTPGAARVETRGAHDALSSPRNALTTALTTRGRDASDTSVSVNVNVLPHTPNISLPLTYPA